MRLKYKNHAISESLHCYLSLVTWVPGVWKTVHPVLVRLIRERFWRSENVTGFNWKKNSFDGFGQDWEEKGNKRGAMRVCWGLLRVNCLVGQITGMSLLPRFGDAGQSSATSFKLRKQLPYHSVEVGKTEWPWESHKRSSPKEWHSGNKSLEDHLRLCQ